MRKLDHDPRSRHTRQMTSRPRKMDPKGKRAAILDAAERLFAARGFVGVTIAEVAAEAVVAVGTVYRLFPDKPALLAALHARMEDRFISVMLSAWERTPDHRVRLGAMVDALLTEALALAPLMPLYSLTRDIVGEVHYRPGERTIAAIIPLYEEGKRAGAFTEMNASLAARVAYAMVDGAMQTLLQSAPRVQKRLQAQAIRAVERAFLAPAE